MVSALLELGPEEFMAKRLGAIAAFVFAGAVVACSEDVGPAPFEKGSANGGSQASGGGNGVTIGPDGLPVGPDGKPLDPKLDGVYELSSEFDLTTAGLLPEVMNDTLSALSNFREQPSQTIVDLLDAANVPLVPTVLNSIPSSIRGFVLGYIDEHVVKALYGKYPVLQQVTGMLDDLASIVTRFELVTRLDLPQANSMGDIDGTHTITGVGYHWDEQRHVISAPELVSQLVERPIEANAVTLEKRSVDLESGRLVLKEHTFSVPIGSFAVYAADQFAKDKFGANNLRGAVGKLIDCEALADNVSKRCVAGVCVGHKPDIKQICTTGLDLLVATVRASIKKLDIPFLDLKNGFAQMWDAPEAGGPLDATIDRIDHGFWTAAINLTAQEKPVVATFTGRRIGDTAQPSR
ncbi:MAG: hypothetical protein KIS78_22005 [Labilithrix sp.]|nr:hypothetical protein [Labilithrix sp.]